VELSTITIIFGDFDGYFFGNVRVKRPTILYGDMLIAK